MDRKCLKETLDHLSKPLFWGNMRTNALIRFVPLCRRLIKTGKVPYKNEHVRSVVNIIQLSSKAMKMHKRKCVEYEGESNDGESEEREDEENEEDYAQIQFIGDNDVDIIGDNEAFESIY